VEHDVQSNKTEHNIIIKENTHNSIYIDNYNKKIQDVLIIPCFNYERLCFKKQLSTYFQIQIELSSTIYICTICLHNINENKPPLYQVPNKVFRNKIIPLVQKLTQLEECLISPHLISAQIYKLQGCEQYKMHGNVTNVSANVDETQLIQPHLPHDYVIISLFLKRHLEYKSPYMSTNVHLNMVMVVS
jgi:hypothetical protein